jgi:hypothetical protein
MQPTCQARCRERRRRSDLRPRPDDYFVALDNAIDPDLYDARADYDNLVAALNRSSTTTIMTLQWVPTIRTT